MKPVAFLVFNRPDCTRKTFNAIRTARPQKLFVIADGPRPSRPDDEQKCREVRRIIDEGVDWPCEVIKNYSVKNLGCARRVSSGLDWAFSQSEKLIVIEDDVLPDQSFFWLCDDLLDRYQEDQRVGQISASPFICNQIDRPYSYIFSRYGSIWGWASWARAWKYYTLTIESWPEIDRSGDFRTFIPFGPERAVKRPTYNKLRRLEIDTWDLQWGYAKMSNSMLSAVSTCNLIENLGFSADATHTFDASTNFLRPGSLKLPLTHPPRVLADARFVEEFSLSCVPAGRKRRFSRLLHRFDRYLAGEGFVGP